MNTRTHKPAFETRLGSIRISVWANENDRGVWFNTTIIRVFKEGDAWKESSSFSGLADLALLKEGIRLAREFIAKATTDNSAEGPSDLAT